MELRNLRSLITLVENGFSVSRAAEQLYLVQPAVSQHIRHMEDELGVQLFVRNGKRLTGLTKVGEQVVQYARKALAETHNILDVGRDHVEQSSGVLRIGTTHTQARYVLPPVIKVFNKTYPEVELQIHQGTPQQLVEMALHDLVDLSICTENLAEHPQLTAVPCYKWNRSLIVQSGHPLLKLRRLTLKALCNYPIITYVFGFTGRGHFSDTFAKHGLKPRVVLSAADTDVIKTYVREGMGVGIIASLAYTPEQDHDLVMHDLSNLFPLEVTKIAYLKGKYLRRYQQRFIELFQDCVSEPGRWSGLLPV
ncbi:MAG: LysR substrate-binding domain-containing protein [Thiogranum sp.]